LDVKKSFVKRSFFYMLKFRTLQNERFKLKNKSLKMKNIHHFSKTSVRLKFQSL